MKKTVLALGCVLFAASSFAQGEPPDQESTEYCGSDEVESVLPAQEITKRIIESATAYANAISCHSGTIKPNQIAALVPWNRCNRRHAAKYAVLWNGDLGCQGGSNSSESYLSIVRVSSTGHSFFVALFESSPVIQFEFPVRYVDRVVGNTQDSLILEGVVHGPNDGLCCPSVKVRFTLRVDEKGNWKLVEEKPLNRVP